MISAGIVAGMVVAVLFSALVFMARRSGKDAEKISAGKAEKNALKKAARARDRLRADTAYAARLRKRFRR
jgi:hypothetical protein